MKRTLILTIAIGASSAPMLLGAAQFEVASVKPNTSTLRPQDAHGVSSPSSARGPVGFGGIARILTSGYGSSVGRVRRTGRVVQFSSARPCTRLNSAMLFVTSLSPRL